MKKLLLLLLVVMILVLACGKKDHPSDNSGDADTAPASIVEKIPVNDSFERTELPTTASAGQESPAEEEKHDLKELEAIGDVEVDQGLFNVEIVLPKQFADSVTDEELEKAKKEKQFKTAKRNEDGSITYVMTKSQHKEMMGELKKGMMESIQEMVGSEDYPGIIAIEANSDFTKFTVMTKSEELTMNESFSVLAFYMYGGMYGIFNGTPADNIQVDFVNVDTGQIINSANSKDMNKK